MASTSFAWLPLNSLSNVVSAVCSQVLYSRGKSSLKRSFLATIPLMGVRRLLKTLATSALRSMRAATHIPMANTTTIAPMKRSHPCQDFNFRSMTYGSYEKCFESFRLPKGLRDRDSTPSASLLHCVDFSCCSPSYRAATWAWGCLGRVLWRLGC